MKRVIALAFLAVCLWGQRDAKSLLQSATKKEAVDGNLAGAEQAGVDQAGGVQPPRAPAAAGYRRAAWHRPDAESGLPA